MSDEKQKPSILIIVAIIGAFATCIAAIIGLAQPFVSRWVDIYLPAGTPTSTQPSPPPSAVSDREPRTVLPRCNCEETVASDEPIIVRLRWGATSQELVEQGANLVVYSLTVDGTPVQGLNEYRKPAVFVAGPAPISGEENLYWVYWDCPLGLLPPGVRVIEAIAVASADIYDGTGTTPAGTKFTSQVKLNVVTPSKP